MKSAHHGINSTTGKRKGSNMTKVLVTGASGFIGTNLFQYLRREQADADIWLFDKHYGQDIRDYDQMRRAVDGMDVIIHLAASTHVDNSIPNPLPFFWNNAEGTVQVLRAVTDEGCRMVYISSSEVYGSADSRYMETHEKMYEDHPLNPQSPYAAAKAAGDRAAYAWWKTYDTDVVTVRPFNQYGPYQAAEKAIPFFIDCAVNGKYLPVYGAGAASRDWLFVQDTVSGIWAAAQKGTAGKEYNLATGKDYSLVELTEVIRDVLGAKGLSVHVAETADRPGHVARLIGGSYYAEKELGWTPKTDLHEGVRITADWLIANGKITSPHDIELRGAEPSWNK